MNLRIAEVADAVSGEILNNADVQIKNISTDSRETLGGGLFFALKAGRDGHDFAGAAVANGASAIVAERALDVGVPVILVEHTGQALLDLAGYYKSLFELELTVGITGSNGKTTVKEFVHAVLSQKYKARKSLENFNNEIGMPKTIFGLQPGERALVLEMGMNHKGEISRLSRAAVPDVGIINNIGTNHIENLGSREGIKQAKCEIMDGMGAGSSIILNADEPLLWCERGGTGKREIFFGVNNGGADFIAENISFDYAGGESSFEIRGSSFKIPALGLHNVYNAVPAYIAGKLCGISDAQIQAGYDNFENVKMRQNIYEFHGITVIDDCYNASLESVKAALAVLSQIGSGRKIAVLSDILECGEYAGEIHAGVGKALVEHGIDKAYAYGPDSRVTFGAAGGRCVYFENKAQVAGRVFAEARKGDAVLFKASRGMAMETVLEDFKKLF